MSRSPMAGYRPGECFVGAARKASRRLTQFYDDALASLRSQIDAIFDSFRASPASRARRRLPNWRARSSSDRSAVGHKSEAAHSRRTILRLSRGVEDRRERRIVPHPAGAT